MTLDADDAYGLYPLVASSNSRIEILRIKHGGASVLVNGAVFKTVSETARAGSGRFDSYTPPPQISKSVGRKQEML